MGMPIKKFDQSAGLLYNEWCDTTSGNRFSNACWVGGGLTEVGIAFTGGAYLQYSSDIIIIILFPFPEHGGQFELSPLLPEMSP